MKKIYRRIPKLDDETIQCPFCNSKLQYSLQPICEYDHNGLPLEGQFILMNCYNCGLNFINQKLINDYQELEECCSLKTFDVSYRDTRETIMKKATSEYIEIESVPKEKPRQPIIDKTEEHFSDFKYEHNDIERKLTIDVFKEHECPKSTIGVIFYEMPKHPKDSLRKAYIVSDIKDEATSRRNSYHQNHPYSRIIFESLSVKSEKFVYQEQERKLHYFYGNKSFYDKLKAYRKISVINKASFDKLVDICIYHGKGLCNKHQRQMEIVTAKIIGTRVKEPQDLQVYYCPTCNEYYINYDYYREFTSKNGIPPLKLIDKNKHKGGYDYYSSLNTESILAIYGYRVSGDLQNNHKFRQRLLEDLIDMELITKAKIISHIEWLIKFRPNARNAQFCWNNDLKHIKSYQKNRQRLVQGVFKAGKNKILK